MKMVRLMKRSLLRTTMRDKIIDIIVKITDYNDLRNNGNVDLIEENILDSLAFMELLTEIETEFDLEIQPTQVDANVWRKVDDIANLIEEKLKNKRI